MDKMYVHSCYVNNGADDAVIVKTSQLDENGNAIPGLDIIRNPKRPFWVTKQKYRTHQFKKEYESMEYLDQHIVYNKDLAKQVFKSINGYTPSGTPFLKKVCNSPYVYGATTDIEVLVKRAYMKKYGDKEPVPFTMGALDIETSVMDDSGNIILITVSHENKYYTAIHDAYFYKNKDGDLPRVKATIDDAMTIINDSLGKYIKEYNLDIQLKVCPDEVEMIKWIWGCIHENKTDFVTIWNMDFDIPKIIEALRKKSVNIEDVMCHPEVPSELRKCHYHHDNRNREQVPHYTELWHWLYCTGYTQITDALNLYSRLRKVKGYKESYTLNAILKEELDLEKLSLGEEGSHFIMQRDRFLDYIAYNIFDVIGVWLLEKKNTDHQTMSILAGITPFNVYAFQTIVLSNHLYDYSLSRNKVPAAVGLSMKTQFTEMIKSKGGTVLPPERSRNGGAKALIERPEFTTMLIPAASDFDFKSYYPSSQRMANISSETKAGTMMSINGSDADVQDYCSNVLNPKSNSVHLGHKYFGLPSYTDMIKEFQDMV